MRLFVFVEAYRLHKRRRRRRRRRQRRRSSWKRTGGAEVRYHFTTGGGI